MGETNREDTTFGNCMSNKYISKLVSNIHHDVIIYTPAASKNSERSFLLIFVNGLRRMW